MLWEERLSYMNKPTFLIYEKPLLCAMIQCPTPDECIEKIRRSIAGGADALGVQLCKLEKQYRTETELKRIFSACEGKPIYVTSYRTGHSKDLTDEECTALLLMGIKCGASLADVMGDMFDQGALYELSTDPFAIEKQKALISKIHAMGGEVLMSCHTRHALSVEENLMIAKAQEERGADVLKIVDVAENKSEIPSYIESIQKIVAATDKRLLLLVSGEGQILRYIGPNFGVCMYLCVESHGELDTKEQPTLAKIKAVRDNILF